MIDNAFKWAASTNNLRRNVIHGEEEANLLLSETFELLDSEGHEIEISGSMEVFAPRLNIIEGSGVWEILNTRLQ